MILNNLKQQDVFYLKNLKSQDPHAARIAAYQRCVSRIENRASYSLKRVRLILVISLIFNGLGLLMIMLFLYKA